MSELGVRLVSVVAGLTAVAGLAACDGGGTDDLTLIAASAEAATDAGTYRLDLTMDMSGAGLPGDVTMTGEGEVDEAEGAVRMTVRLQGAGLPGATGGFEMQIVLIGTVVYMNMGDLAAEAGVPSSWISFDLSSVPGLSDLMSGAGGLGATDPSQMLAYLWGAGDVEEVGSEDVRGVDTTRYRTTIDLQDALQALPSDQQDAFRRAQESLGLDLDLQVPAEVWIDGDGLPRRLQMDMEMGGMSATDDIPEGSRVAFTMELFDFGAPIDIQPPPPDEVTDVTEMMEGELSS